ncbi:restriction endonuclease subunit S [Klebsiella grimontii]|uniref:restriction endonuclease subunit S n=1 Tax=Klebsiella grimontii TaxID=2058152 RepID=UPI00311E9506
MSGGKLPEEWVKTTIGVICEVKGGKRLPKGKALLNTATEHPYIRVTDFENGSVNLSTIKYLDSDTYSAISNYTISKNDLYISIAGTIGLIGEIPEQLDNANLTENAAKLCFILGTDKKYLKHVLSSNKTIEQFDDKTTSREGANKRGNSSRLTQSFHFFMFEPIFSPVNALNQPI